MKKIKLLLVTSNLLQGGAERQFVELIKGINKDNFEITVLLYAVQKDVFFQEIFSISGITIIKNSLKNKFWIFKIMEALKFLYSFLKTNNFDLIFSLLFMNNLFVRLAAGKFYNNKIITGVRNNIKSYPKFYLIFEKFLIKNSFIVFNSENAKNQFKSLFKKKFHKKLFVIYNGFETNINYSDNKIDKDRVIIGCLGRQTNVKNFIQPIRVLNQINKREKKSYKILLKGSYGNQSDTISNFSKSNPNLIEYDSFSPDINSYFKKISIFILPSFFEGCPNVIFESMLRYRICIISKTANSDNFISNGINGFEFDGSEKDLEKKIIYVISILNTKKYFNVINNAHSYVVNNFSKNKMLSDYESLFYKLKLMNEGCN